MLLTGNQHSTEHAGTTSTGSLLSGSLNFSLSQWTIHNVGTVPVRFTLGSTSATTDDAEVRPGTSTTLRAPSSKYGVMTTSTSTDGRDLRRVRLTATGG